MQIGLASPITHAYTDIIPGHALEVLLVHLLEGRAGGGGGAAAARRQVGGAGVAAAVLAALLLHDGRRHAHHDLLVTPPRPLPSPLLRAGVSILLARRQVGGAVAAQEWRRQGEGPKALQIFALKTETGWRAATARREGDQGGRGGSAAICTG